MSWSSPVALALSAWLSSPEVLDAQAADRQRIQRHLAAVEADLRARPVEHLPPELRRERARNLDRLHDYWTAGVFPRNDDFPGERVPYFIDDDGVVCAVGHLVVESGFVEVAREIQRTENNARLLAMNHPALPTWIAASGLTAEECATIQPSYCNCPKEYKPVCGEDDQSYANACVAECSGVAIVHEGVCESPETTGWPPPGGKDEDGCDGCRAAEGPPAWAALLFLLPVFRRRRGRC